jgi:hypothetical protein
LILNLLGLKTRRDSRTLTNRFQTEENRMSLRSITPVVVCAAAVWVWPARAESSAAPEKTTPAPTPATAPAGSADKKAEPAKLSNDALDLLVSGIALYPDPTLTAILEASTHPVELRKGDADSELDAQRDSLQRVMRAQAPKYITDLGRYPGVRAPLVDHIQLTAALGKEFKLRPTEVWAAIRRVRAQVEKAGAAAAKVEKTDSKDVAAAPAPVKPGDKPTPTPALNAVVTKLLATPAAADLAKHLPAMNAIENPKADEKAATDEKKSADAKSVGDKSTAEAKATEPKAADVKSTDTKTIDAKPADAKKPAEDPYAKADSAKVKLVNAALRENWDSVSKGLAKSAADTAQKPATDAKEPQAK